MGVTHLCIALANYCCSFHHAKTALAELNSTGELRRIGDSESQSPFSVYGVDYYPALPIPEVPALYNQDYNYVIFDFGAAAETSPGDFQRCDRKLIVGSLAPWRSGVYKEFLSVRQPTQQLGGNAVCLALFGSRADLLEFSLHQRLPLRAIPFIANPFQLEKNLFSFLENLI